MTYPFLKLAVASAIVAFTAVSTPARAGGMVQRLGPVGPDEPILTSVGNKRVVAFFTPDSGTCGIRVVLWKADDLDAKSAWQFRVNLDPGQVTQIGSVTDMVKLQCGDFAQTLAAIGKGNQFATNH